MTTIALLVTVVKAAQLAFDHTPLFFSDSGAFILNALGIEFSSFRSYVYGWLIRLVAVPLASLTALVAVQVLMGGMIAWMLAFGLMRYFAVREWIAAVMALLFALDPMQIVHEHLVMTETSSLLLMAATLLASLEYLRRPNLYRLAAVPVLGIVLVGLRIVYVPLVLFIAVALPVTAYVSGNWRRPRIRDIRALGAPLVVSVLAELTDSWLGSRVVPVRPADFDGSPGPIELDHNGRSLFWQCRTGLSLPSPVLIHRTSCGRTAC